MTDITIPQPPPDPVDPPIHEYLAPLAFFLGTWRGSGTGTFHRNGDFVFEEEIVFSHRGGAVMRYEQRSWSPEDGTPIHVEAGFWRLVDEDSTVNAYVSLTAGSDFSEGKLDGTSLSLEVRQAPMADPIEQVTGLRRSYRVAGDVMDYEIWLGTEGQPFQSHVSARLHRV